LPNNPLAGLTVLIVEDEYLIAIEAKRIIDDAGAARTLLASTVAKAREVLQSAGVEISVCILDVKLGEETGLALIEDLGARGIPYVVATGYSDTLGDGDHLVIRKPYHDNQMIAAILAVVAAKRQPEA
jgi:DNA-binding NtrC family response regulator